MNATSPHTQPPALEPPDPQTRGRGDGEKINGHSLPPRGPTIQIVSTREPRTADQEAALDAFFGAQRKMADERRAAVDVARPALARLCQVLRVRGGQSYKLRALLYSLYNGQAASLIEIVCLDWNIRQDLCALLLAFGYESHTRVEDAFYYDALKAAITATGQWDWFIACDEESEGTK